MTPRFPTLGLDPDGRYLFLTRSLRLFAYGFLSVVLVLYLAQIGLSEQRIGWLLSLTLAGDTLVSLWITLNADRFGRRRMLVLGAGLMLFAGILFALTTNFWILLVAATIGVVSPSGNEVGPFLAVEQAALAQKVPDRTRTYVFAWYNVVGFLSTALGAAAGGGLAQLLQNSGTSPADSYRVVVLGYAFLGLVLALLFGRLSTGVETKPAPVDIRKRFGLHRSQGIVFRLSAMFALDAFAGGFIVQSIMAYWFHQRFGAAPAMLGAIFFVTNVLAGISALVAARIAARIGLINTMVVTHIPSNLLLILVPFMPTLVLAVLVLLLRSSISQMDVPTRQSYTMAIVSPDERSAAAGITGLARTTGAAVAPSLAGVMLANPLWMGAPFVVAGLLKIIYDLMLYASFRSARIPDEQATRPSH
jgi:MFS family permease